MEEERKGERIYIRFLTGSGGFPSYVCLVREVRSEKDLSTLAKSDMPPSLKVARLQSLMTGKRKERLIWVQNKGELLDLLLSVLKSGADLWVSESIKETYGFKTIHPEPHNISFLRPSVPLLAAAIAA